MRTNMRFRTTPRPADPRHLAGIATDLADRRDLWPTEIRFDPDNRWYYRLPTDDGIEAWLLSWLPGQSTGLHDHGDASGAFLVVEGSLRETAVTLLPGGGVRDAVRTLDAGQTRAFGSRHIHDVANRGPLLAVSLHVYAPALTIMRRYRRLGDQLVQTAVERAGEDW